MAYDRNRPFTTPDFQQQQERVAARMAARAQAREATRAAEASRGRGVRASGDRASTRSSRSMRAGDAAQRRFASSSQQRQERAPRRGERNSSRGIPVRAPVRSQGGVQPSLVSFQEARGISPLLLALAAVVAVVLLVLAVGQVRGCADQHRLARVIPVSQLPAHALAQARSDLDASGSPLPLFEQPRTTPTAANPSTLDGLMEDGLAVSHATARKLLAAQPSYARRVSPMLQLPEYQSGCEVVSLAMALRSMGYTPLVEDLIDCLVMDGNFSQGFAGSPYAEGGAFPRGIVKAANAYLQQQGSKVRAHDLSGSSFESVVALAQAGYPVLVWTTMYMDDIYLSEDYEWNWRWYWNEHVVVLCGTRNGELLVADPLEGAMVRNYQAFKQLYETCGSMALLLHD